jgi:heptosyltransferase-2
MAQKILFITLSNIGDVVLTLPALDFLRGNFPGAQITVIAGERAGEIFKGNPNISKFIPFNKKLSWFGMIKLFNSLRREKFDVIADMRNSFLGYILGAKIKTSPFLSIPGSIKHMKDRHLYRISKLTKNIFNRASDKSIYFSPEDKERVDGLLRQNNIEESDKLIVVAGGARSHTKRWPKEKFAELILKLIEYPSLKIVLAGDKEDAEINGYIASVSGGKALDLSAKTTLNELAYLLKRASLLISNDSAPLHIASYLNTSVVAIFGITDDEKYGPWSEGSYLVKKEVPCRPCSEAQCKFGTLECISLIKVEDVFRAVKNILSGENRKRETENRRDYKRILIARTDRIGDVILSTPVIKALRERYPKAYIAMMVSAYAKDVVEGNPYLDKVIVLDKDKQHKGWFGSFKFIGRLKKNKFDLCLILHPTNRVHLLTYLSGIPKRVGYDRKSGFLLTDKIKHSKQFGLKHELDYNLDLLRYLGIEASDKELFIPIKAESEKWLEELFKREGINEADKLLAIHPAASCPSKIWPAERFAEASDKLAEKYGFKILVIAGPKDAAVAKNLVSHMRSATINLGAKTSVTQLASLLKRCKLLISNDSGPVHIASAVGTPVISIFARNQAGLSPKRWGPVGKNDKILHKAICIECLAHKCKKQFACLKAITVEDVISAADVILK